MRKITTASIGWVTALLLMGAVSVQAQVFEDFEGDTLGHSLDAIGWGGMVAEIALDPLDTNNQVLKFTPNNFNAAPVIALDLYFGKTLADYGTFTFKGFFLQGDVGFKDIIVEAYQTLPTGQFNDDPADTIGTWTRSSGESTEWEEITVNISNSRTYTGTIYIAFGIHCAGIGGANDSTTIWYADDVELVPVPVPFDTYPVANWGTLNGRWGGLLLESDTGYVSMSGPVAPNNWASAVGAFSEPLEFSTSDAVIVTGTFELLGGDFEGNPYTPMRYGFYNFDNLGVPGIDSSQMVIDSSVTPWDTTYNTAWDGGESSYGYSFMPTMGTGTPANSNKGQGEVWYTVGGSWISTWGDAVPIGRIPPAPARAYMTEGVYDFAMSVHSLGTMNEVRFSLVKQLGVGEEQTTYWFGGTVIDSVQTTSSIDGIAFSINNGDVTGFVLDDVQVDMGDPITIPEKPFSSYYVDSWGTLNGRWGGLTLEYGDFVGDVSMSGADAPNNWASVVGSFFEPLEIVGDKSVIVRGTFELLGGDFDGNPYTPLRYGFYNFDDLGALGLDSTQMVIDSSAVPWDTTYNMAWDGGEASYGYSFMPTMGSGTPANSNKGQGEVWYTVGGSWISTWGDAVPIGRIPPAPARAYMTEGVYDFEMSVRSMGAMNEVSFFLVKQLGTGEDQTTYWFGGTVIDSAKTTTNIDGVAFSINNGNVTGFSLAEVTVDYGAPSAIPEKPFNPYYVDAWGTLNGRWGNSKLEYGDFVGDVTMSAEAPTSSWASAVGAFFEPLEIKEDKAVIITGTFELLGGDFEGNPYTPLRYGFYNFEDLGALATDETQMYIDSSVTPWDTTYNMAWDGVENSYGYSFMPTMGTGTPANSNLGQAEAWFTVGGSWISTWGNAQPFGKIPPAPARAYMTTGVYDFAMSVHSLGKTNEVRFYLVKQLGTGEDQPSYWFGGILEDPEQTTTSINGLAFSINNGSATGFALAEVQVDYGDPLDPIPEKPFTGYYVDGWGISGGLSGGWLLEYGDFVGDVSVAGTAAADTMVAIRGGFVEPHKAKTDKALKVSGSIELVGGGFEDPNSLLFGLFYSDAAGELAEDPSLDTNWAWSGAADQHTGYLIVPPSGTNGPADWTGVSATGTAGAIAKAAWMSTDDPKSHVVSSAVQYPPDAVGGAGTYDFNIEVGPLGNGMNALYFELRKQGGGYRLVIEGMDNFVPLVTEEFNCVGFAIDNATTTAMNLIEIKVDMIALSELSIDPEKLALPTAYALRQNYPNPFNPTSTILYELPEVSDVSLVVYNILGREVVRLVNSTQEAGYHHVVWNGRDARGREMTSGIYIARMITPEYTKSIKMLLVK